MYVTSAGDSTFVVHKYAYLKINLMFTQTLFVNFSKNKISQEYLPILTSITLFLKERQSSLEMSWKATPFHA
jgi:hypothetical protein